MGKSLVSCFLTHGVVGSVLNFKTLEFTCNAVQCKIGGRVQILRRKVARCIQSFQ